MMQNWADQEEQERDRFLKRGNDYSKRNNDHRNDRGQRDYSRSSQKCKPDDLVAAINRAPQGKKNNNNNNLQEEFDKLLHKQCPWHPHSKHAAFECYQLRRSQNTPPLDKGDKKKKKKEDKDNEDPENKTDAGISRTYPRWSTSSSVVNRGLSPRGLRSFIAARSCPSSLGTTTPSVVGGPHLVL
ncbi:retrotransposon protein, putative, Ty3-gypsy subclass [Panicum miliaceum]|uniref:Retrotransposon protein, putative, Ty3-gypsy subclass n=1 Tax=Panicum miliaceum TaxID=4540 RepID=A0A3L6RGG6_PANMI|nr:retrotransposon protein, putative, Ty3-gypsy subclass [Panicum miliaceum]